MHNTVIFETIVRFIIPLAAQLALSPMTWHKEHLQNFSVP
jgi:hypothetical protein